MIDFINDLNLDNSLDETMQLLLTAQRFKIPKQITEKME